MPRPARPNATTVAAALTAAQGLALVVTGVVYAVSGLVRRAESAVGAEVGAVLIAGAGVLVLLAARALWRGADWPVAPLVVVQLLAVLVGLSMLSTRERGAAVAVAAVGLATLVALGAARAGSDDAQSG